MSFFSAGGSSCARMPRRTPSGSGNAHHEASFCRDSLASAQRRPSASAATTGRETSRAARRCPNPIITHTTAEVIVPSAGSLYLHSTVPCARSEARSGQARLRDDALHVEDLRRVVLREANPSASCGYAEWAGSQRTTLAVAGVSTLVCHTETRAWPAHTSWPRAGQPLESRPSCRRF